MKTRIVKWNNLNGHIAYKMAVTENCLGRWWAVSIGWKPRNEWEKHLIQTIKNGNGFLDLDGFAFKLSIA